MDQRQNKRSLWVGGIGVGLQCLGLMYGLFEQDTNGDLPAGVFPIVMAVTWGGSGLIVWGLALHARAKGHSAWWGAMGVFGIVGLIALAVLRDRQEDPELAIAVRESAARPVDRAAMLLSCRSCGYILNMVEGNRCPECGRPFDLSVPYTLQAVPRGPDAKAPWTARWSMVCGILSVVSFFIPIIGLILSTLAVLMGRHAYCGIQAREGMHGWAHAKTGLVLGSVLIAPALAFTVYGFYLMVL